MENWVYGEKAKCERQCTICGINNKYKIQSGFGMCERVLMSVLKMRNSLMGLGSQNRTKQLNIKGHSRKVKIKKN